MATTNSKTTTTTEMPAHAQKIREQLVSTIRQGQQLSVDGAQTWAKAVSALPVVLSCRSLLAFPPCRAWRP